MHRHKGVCRSYNVGDIVTVKAPATSANLGCGFDAFGIALDIWLTLTVQVSETFECSFTGQEDDSIPTDSSNAIVLAFTLGLRHLRSLPACGVNFSFRCYSDIPVARGLGSSAAAIVAGLGAAFALCGRDLRSKSVLQELAVLACRRENHPDNVLPAIFGGMQIGVMRTAEDARVCFNDDQSVGDFITQALPFPREEISCIIYMPYQKLSTKAARKLLPSSYSKSDVIQNIGRCGILVAALLLRDYENLKFAVEDRLHQPYRIASCPSFEIMKDAMPATDALACYLSGAGSSSVVWVRREQSTEIMEELKNLCGTELTDYGNFVCVDVSNVGVCITHEIGSNCNNTENHAVRQPLSVAKSPAFRPKSGQDIFDEVFLRGLWEPLK